MTNPNRCPQCGNPLPIDAPAGICPRCVLALGFRRQVAANPLPATSPATPTGRFVPPKPHELQPLFPQLEILELVGSGGMGAVYKARQAKLDRIVALKILPPEVGQDPAFAERFAREARTLGRLGHPGIVGIYDFGQAGNLYYLLMEYVDGSNLRQVIDAGKLAPAEALAIVPQVCEALQYAHDEGVVHRDIKPENILLDKKGRAKIADFGLAKLLAHPPGSFTLTDTQQVMGTPHYMAPEQLTSTRAVDHRADIYSLGVVFYEMLTGELPLGRFEPPSKRAGVDARLDEVVLRTLERTPERRYQQASHVKTDVESISRVGPQQATAAMVPPPRQTFAWDWFGIGLGLLLPALALIAFALFWTKSAWTLSALAVPWFAIFVWGGYLNQRRSDQVVGALALLLFLASLAFIGCGVWLENSILPLTAVLLYGITAIGGGGLGWAIREEETKSESGVATSPDQKPDVAPEEDEDEDEDEEDEETAEEVVGTPATWMAIVGGIGCWWLLSDGANVVQTLVQGKGIVGRADLVWVIGAPLVLVGGLLGRALRWYGFVLAAALLCIPMGLVADDFLVRVVPFGIGIWLLVVLAREDVRAAFRKGGRRNDSGGTSPAHAEIGPDGWPVKPEMPPSLPEAKRPRGTLGRAWDAWWGERDRWFTNLIQAALSIVALACWICFLNFQMSSETTPGDAKLRHTTVRFGFPDSWFHLEKYPEPLVPFRWTIDYFSYSTLILVVGCVAWYVYWQIEKAKPDAKYVWLGSANAIIIFWGVLSALIAIVTILIPL